MNPSPRRTLALAICFGFVWGASCLPPQGVGPIPLPMEVPSGTARLTLQYAGHPERHAVEVDLSMAGHIDDYFSIEAGVLYTALRDPELYPWQADSPWQFKHSGLPYARPTVHLGPVTIAAAVSGFFAMGPQAGAAYGFGSLAVGYAAPRWAAFAGVAGHGFKYLTDHSEPTGSAWQVSVGGQRFWVLDGGLLLGFDAELVYSEQTYTDHGPSDERARRFLMLVVGFDIGYHGE